MRPDSRSASTASNVPRPIDSLWVLGARLTWVFLGPAALFFLAAGIVNAGTGWFTALDGLFALVVGAMLLGRWVERRSGSATTVAGEASTPDQFRRYMTGLPIAAAGVWIVANVLGNHLLR